VQADAAEQTIPVHPWQLTISPVAAALLAASAARATNRTLRCKPLCSQRTLRVQSTGYDIKLAVDASITSEHRLLYRLNCENAPAVSALVTRLIASRAPASIAMDIQPDVASLSFADPRFSAHLAAIVRPPIRVGAAERALPAIDLWTGRETAAALLSGADADDVNAFFERYCATLLTGPVAFLFHFGLAFEPHLQNSVIVFRGREPVRLIIRDLDGTIMDPTRVPQLLAQLDLTLAADTWEHMPSAEIGEHRLVHSLFFGHIVEVVDFLTQRCGAARDELMSILGRQWARLPAIMDVRGANERFSVLCEHLERGKSMLVGRLAKSTKMTFVDLPRDAPFAEASQFFWREL